MNSLDKLIENASRSSIPENMEVRNNSSPKLSDHLVERQRKKNKYKENIRRNPSYKQRSPGAESKSTKIAAVMRTQYLNTSQGEICRSYTIDCWKYLRANFTVDMIDVPTKVPAPLLMTYQP